MWTFHRTVSLIEDLKRSPCLWDIQSADYKSRTKKNHTIEILSKKYAVDTTDIEKKIQGLKNQFRREHKRILHLQRCGTYIKKAPWFGYEKLLFLLPSYEARGSYAHISDAHDNTQDGFGINVTDLCKTEEDDDYADVSNDVAVETTDAEERLLELSSQLPKPKDDDTNNKVAFNFMKILTDSFTKRDEFSVYGEHIANKLRQSGRNRYEVAVAQHHIDDVCFKLATGAFAQQKLSNSHTQTQPSHHMPSTVNQNVSPLRPSHHSPNFVNHSISPMKALNNSPNSVNHSVSPLRQDLTHNNDLTSNSASDHSVSPTANPKISHQTAEITTSHLWVSKGVFQK